MAQLRTGTRVTRILTKAGGVTGVVLPTDRKSKPIM